MRRMYFAGWTRSAAGGSAGLQRRRCGGGAGVSPGLHEDDLQAATAAALGTPISDLARYADVSAPTTVRVRGRAEKKRIGKRVSFLHLRQPAFDSVQVVAASASAAESLKVVTPESIVDVYGTVMRLEKPVRSASCADYEIRAERIEVVSAAQSPLPFPRHDVNTKLDTRLDHRSFDLRTPLTAAMLRLVSAAAGAFRGYLSARGFVEIHTPKLIPAASEGGSAVFKVDYFGQPAFLAQSPQLYKQMAVMGDALRVFEVGPVFRSENSLTHRHLTEFVGLDAELVLRHSYYEVMDVLEGTMCHVIATLQTKHVGLMDVVAQHIGEPPEDPVKATGGTSEPRSSKPIGSAPAPIVMEVSEAVMAQYNLGSDAAGICSGDTYHARVGGTSECGQRVLRLAFREAVRLLLDNGAISEAVDDFTLPQERAVGELIRKRYGVDLYVIDQFPLVSRPFYTQPHPTVPGMTCSFDMYLRGEEICSGAQRIHDADLLARRIRESGIDPAPLDAYVNSFRYGAWPHGGFGLGLERIIMFLTGAHDIRQVSLFPRDPRRISP